jgi:predicted DNA-binding protein (MmcQ/YjbR family)
MIWILSSLLVLLCVLLVNNSDLEAETGPTAIVLTQLHSNDPSAVDIKVDMTQNFGLAGMSLKLEYDHSLMALTGVERGPALNALAFDMTADYAQEPFSFRWSGATENDFSFGILMLMHFTLVQGQPEGTCQVNLTYETGDVTKYNTFGKMTSTLLKITPCSLEFGSDLSLEILGLVVAQTVLVMAIGVFIFFRKVKIVYVVGGQERFVDRYKRGEKIILRTFEGYAMYWDAKFKKRLEKAIVPRFKDIYIYCRPEENHPEPVNGREEQVNEPIETVDEPVMANKPETEQEMKPALKTADEWLNIEREVVCQLIDDNKDPFAYLLKELSQKNNPESRNAALKKLLKELDKIQENSKKVPESSKQELTPIDLVKVMEVTYQQPLHERMEVLRESANSFVCAKRKGLPVIVPVLPFLFTREDVLDYMEVMKEKPQRYPVPTNVTLRSKRHLPDGLKCGEWTFALMYEKGDVIKFIARMDDAFVANVMKEHTGIKTSLFPKGTNWHDVMIDSSYVSKGDVYALLDSCYDFVLNKYYEKEAEKSFRTDVPSAKEDESQLQVSAVTNAEVVDYDYTTAVSEHQESLRKYKENVGSPFAISRSTVLAFVRKTIPKTSIMEHDKFYMPVSLKNGRRTYAMIYERFGEIRMVVRIPDEYAGELLVRHPLMTKAKFPNARHWYTLLVDGSFEKPEQVYQIIKKAQDFARIDEDTKKEN